MQYRLEYYKDGKLERYGLIPDDIAGLRAHGASFVSGAEAYRFIRREFQTHLDVHYDRSFEDLENDNFLVIVPAGPKGSVGTIPEGKKGKKFPLTIYCVDLEQDIDGLNTQQFEGNGGIKAAFANSWNAALNTSKTPISKSLPFNPSGWGALATVTFFIGLIIEAANPAVAALAFPYLSILASVFAGIGLLAFLGSIIYAIGWEIKHPKETNPIADYFRDRWEWMVDNPGLSLSTVGIGSFIILLVLVFTIGYFMGGPGGYFDFMKPVFDFMSQVIVQGIHALGPMTASIPGASLMPFASIASAVVFITGLIWLVDSVCRIANAWTDSQLPVRNAEAPATAKQDETKGQGKNPFVEKGRDIDQQPPTISRTNPFSEMSGGTTSPTDSGEPKKPRAAQRPAKRPAVLSQTSVPPQVGRPDPQPPIVVDPVPQPQPELPEPDLEKQIEGFKKNNEPTASALNSLLNYTPSELTTQQDQLLDDQKKVELPKDQDTPALPADPAEQLVIAVSEPEPKPMEMQLAQNQEDIQKKAKEDAFERLLAQTPKEKSAQDQKSSDPRLVFTSPVSDELEKTDQAELTKEQKLEERRRLHRENAKRAIAEREQGTREAQIYFPLITQPEPSSTQHYLRVNQSNTDDADRMNDLGIRLGFGVD